MQGGVDGRQVQQERPAVLGGVAGARPPVVGTASTVPVISALSVSAPTGTSTTEPVFAPLEARKRGVATAVSFGGPGRFTATVMPSPGDAPGSNR
ncbi:hypothetical protein NQP46_10190 [Streptomyces albus]|nr:hypothetical protein NQP46_10190 [Streptomyces albus]